MEKEDADLDRILGTGDSGVDGSEGGGGREEYVEPEGGQHSEPEGDGQPEDGEPERQSAEHTSWEDTPLPEDHPFFGKYRSLGDLTKANRSSREEALRLHKENEELRRFVMERQQQQPQQSPRTEPTADNDFFGYGSMDAYQKSLQIDPRGTLQKVFDHVIKSKQDMFEKMVEERVNAAIQPFRMQQRQEALQHQWEALAQREPELRKDSPAQQACVDYMANHKKEVQAILDNPRIQNPVEVIYRNATYGLLRAQLENQSKRVEGKRRMAATARPGTGRGATPKDDGSPRSLVEAAVADAAAAGVTVSKSAQQQMERELRRANLNY